MLRTERSSFSLTMYADEACDPYTPREHLPRAPTIIWDPRETQPLLDLRNTAPLPHDDGGARASLAAGLEPELDEEAEVGRVSHFHPSVAYALRRGIRGLGHAHAAPPPPEATGEGDARGEGVTKTAERLAFPHVTNRLSQVQLRLLDGQNSAARTSLRRVIAILRRRRRQRHRGTFCLLDFLRAFHTECGLRMVHLAFYHGADTETAATAYDATMAYSLDQGGRFYIMIRWRGLGAPERGADPKVRVHSPADQYWGDARITPTSRIEFCRYACPCAIHTTTTTTIAKDKEGAP